MARPARINISRVRWAVLYSEQGGRCAGCHKPLGEDIHVDHVVPLAGGGQDIFENMQLMHGACNLAKRAMGPAEWFRRSWQAFLATSKLVPRRKITLMLEPELFERLRAASYWSRQSMTALMEEGAAHALKAFEEGRASIRPLGEAQRLRVATARGRWSATAVAASMPQAVAREVRHGDLFGD
ncbi:HNH endonuclease [Lichenicola cladoniae]|uniref:HNH endonuclease n=1 Tax=Lichenicola cladoniae TaxID=1484109 RepID=A0A6M8HU74_9PROT|nr:HNH endonuclease [Lichenicola cladoniae]NPD68293.1 HNH endonuclease [Acetobacteraceae bacterium]QKE91892.1 HNH endonuclease [Lichenicola cladoniae]